VTTLRKKLTTEMRPPHVSKVTSRITAQNGDAQVGASPIPYSFGRSMAMAWWRWRIRFKGNWVTHQPKMLTHLDPDFLWLSFME
jgi:hypothetical protein